VEPAAPPPGISIGPIEIGEEREVHRTIEDAFDGTFGWTEQTFDDFRHDTLEAATFDPELMLVAREGGAVVGVLHGIATEREGHVSVVAVRLGSRGRGIGEALMRRSFWEFARRGLDRVWLNVDSENEAGAVRLYERVGMRPRRRWIVFEGRPGGG
jgi:mycothiol synthase